MEKTAAKLRGVKQLSEHVAKRAEGCNVSIVDCTTGAIYSSIKEAALQLKLLRPNISAVLSGKSKYCDGRRFKYVAEWDGVLLPRLTMNDIRTWKKRSVVDCTTGIAYSSIQEAASQLKVLPQGITTNLSGVNKSCGGRVFKYVEQWDGILVPTRPLGDKIRNKTLTSLSNKDFI